MISRRILWDFLLYAYMTIFYMWGRIENLCTTNVGGNLKWDPIISSELSFASLSLKFMCCSQTFC